MTDFAAESLSDAEILFFAKEFNTPIAQLEYLVGVINSYFYFPITADTIGSY